MSDNDTKPSEPQDATGSPLVFISHDSRDFEFAEAFSQLLRSVSLGMLKSFRSTDKKGTEGIEYGDEWYKRLMSKLGAASDVVCLFTRRSLDRPWILYEAGVAKGKLNTPVYGIALGIPLKTVSTGPFYQFQNCGDSDDELTKLVLQLARRVKGADPDESVVRSQVVIFKLRVDELVSAPSARDKEPVDPRRDELQVAKMFEEVKVMFREVQARIEHRLGEDGRPSRRVRIDPEMFEGLIVGAPQTGDPVGLLVAAGLMRDEAPWLSEITLEAYRSVRTGSQRDLQRVTKMLHSLEELGERSPFMNRFVTSPRMEWFVHYLPRLLRAAVEQLAVEKKATSA